MIQNSNAVCCKEYQGRMRFQAQQKLLEICDGHEWLKIDLKSTPGQKSNPAASCKDILSHMTEPSQQKNGVYWIRFRGGGMRHVFTEFCKLNQFMSLCS